MEAKGEVIRGGFAGRVEVFDLVVAAADEVVVTDNDAGDGGEEDGVGAQVRGEVVGRREKVPGEEVSSCILMNKWIEGRSIPRAHGQADGGADVATAADVQVAW